MAKFQVTRWGRYSAHVIVEAQSEEEANDIAFDLDDEHWYYDHDCEDGEAFEV
jgi:hypothetical protein